MFDNEQPSVSCPVEETDKAWIEHRLSWLVHQFGWARLRTADVILPTPEFFPDPFNGHPDDVQLLLERVCDYMGLAPETVEATVYQDRDVVHEERGRPSAAGMEDESSGKFRLYFDVQNLADPLSLVAGMARQAAQVFLVGHERISADEEDCGPLADLLTVFLGMGVFTANSVLGETYWQQGYVAGWSMTRRGYLTMPMYGYALALFAWCRDEIGPAWADALRPDVRSAFDQAVKFLTETEDSAFRPGRLVPQSRAALPPLAASVQRPDAQAGTADDDEEEDAGATPSATTCSLCGEEMAPGLGQAITMLANVRKSQPEPGELICQECRASIEENDHELAEEARAYDRSTSQVLKFIIIGFAVFGGICLVVTLLQNLMK